MDFLDIGQEKSVYADGIHDDTKALQACLDKMKNGGTIYFPDGTYLISAALIFYSNQWLKFSDKAIILRSSKSTTITRYLLASYSEPSVAGYDGTHDVVISGGIFDGNEDLSECLTMINTVHCTNITVKNCKFTHCAHWHCIEINSTTDALIIDCIFEGEEYTAIRENLTSEILQIDAAAQGTYGPVYNCDGKLIEFSMDKTPCCDIKIASNIFKCAGFPGIGHHDNYEHTDIKIHNNIFIGTSGKFGNSRGFIIFMEKVHNIDISDNAFISKAEKNIPNLGIVIKNQNTDSCLAENNTFIGNFSEHFTGGITAQNNSFQ